MESTIKEKYNLEAQIESFKDDIAGLKEAHADEVKIYYFRKLRQNCVPGKVRGSRKVLWQKCSEIS